MRPLPPLAAGSSPLVLPMADRSAAVLVEALLAEADVATELLVEQFAADPPLALWVVCMAARRDDLRPRSLVELAAWLRQHAVEVLQWDGAEYTWPSPPGPPGTEQAEQHADRASHLLQVAEVAALLAASDGQQAAEEAFLRGLLHAAPQWFPLASGRRRKTISDCLARWLATADESVAASRVREAAAILAHETEAAPADFDAEDCRQRALEARDAWLETVEGAVEFLPVLAARLARLDQLENRFQEALQTEKLESLAEFAAGAGHEINNPLAIIGGRAQLLLEDETDAERRRELAVVTAQVKRAHEMIADMRLFARPPLPEPETLDLVALVDGLVVDLAPLAAERAISITRSGDEGPVEVEADRAQLEVALRALSKNSLEAIGHDGRVEITLRRGAGHVQIRVADDGAGIRPEHRRHLFDPFYSARQAGRGLGFGLSKCWRIVTNHGGRIDVESEPGQGAVFTITLPERWSG